MLIAADHLLGTPGATPAAPGYVELTGAVISGVGSGPPPGQPDVLLPDGYLLPGLVDLQVNGYFGADFQTGDQASWELIARRLPETGTTAFAPTIITAPVASLAQTLSAAAAFVPRLPATSARVLGVHMEGPFISPARRGAHNDAWITDPHPAAVTELIEAGRGLLRLVTIAPERPGALTAISELAAAGIVVSVGHSDATASQVSEAADRGARMVTHLFNAQRPLGHREPGVVGQALFDERLTSGLIADLHHVAASICGLAFRAAPDRIVLVTDAAAAAGMAPGDYLLGGQQIRLPAGESAPPVRPDGTLAGSALRLDRAVANAVRCGLSLPAAAAAATRLPADLIGRPDLGRLAPGAAGDLVWLSPRLRTRATWIAGRLVYTEDDPATRAAVRA